MKGTVGAWVFLVAMTACERQPAKQAAQSPRGPIQSPSPVQTENESPQSVSIAPSLAAPRESRSPALGSGPNSRREVISPSSPQSGPSAVARTPEASHTPAPPQAANPEPSGTEDSHMILIEESEDPSASGSARGPKARSTTRTQVRAGSADDNLQFGAFLRFLSQNAHLGRTVDVTGRIVVTVADKEGLPLANTRLQVLDGENVLVERRTYADGRALLFPGELRGTSDRALRLRASFDGTKLERSIEPKSGRSIELKLATNRPLLRRVPLDVVFIMDATGSMQDEIDELRDTLQQVIDQVTHFTPRPDLRLGMVLYRDKDSGERTTELIPVTRNYSSFQWALQAVRASGGDDYAEDVQSGLQQALTAIKWNTNGIRLGFLIGDAPPHLDGYHSYSYVKAMKDAARRGIKLTTIGASGLDRRGELVWRQLAQYTLAPFVFLTYGEEGDAEGGRRSVSHHVGSNWVAESLDAVIVRMIKSELQSYGPQGAPAREDYFEASYHPGVQVAPVFEELFERSVQQLVDYALERIGQRTPTAMLPIQTRDGSPEALARNLEHRLGLALSRNQSFRLVEVETDPRIDAMVRAQFRERFDESERPSLGKQIPAKLAVVSELGHGRESSYVLLVKLIRLETNEVLSVSLLKIDARLGGGMMTAARDSRE